MDASSRPQTCGVRVLWVESSSRREGIATMLMDAIHTVLSLKPGMTIVAFSLQTLDGEQFSRGYFRCPEYYLYDCN